MKQLKMRRPSAPIVAAMPDGYAIVPFGGSAAEIGDWLAIVAEGLVPVEGGEAVFDRYIRNWRDLTPEEDLFFVTDPTGKRVATIAAVRHPDRTGYIHMVGSHPVCRGKGVGRAMLAHALDVIESRGVDYTILTTDDFRLPAIKLYLDAGFRPVLWNDPDSDMIARWNKVIETLGYSPVEYLAELD